jgi:hypothetical protein
MHALIAELLTVSEGPFVSLYIPVLAGESHHAENKHRLSRVLDDVTARLKTSGLSDKGLSQFFARARSYMEKDLEKGSGAGTLAMFLAPSVFHADVLPIELPERAIVGTRFYVTPILSFLDTLHYYVLAVSKKSAHFLEVKGSGIEAKDIAGMPHSLEEAWQGMERDEESIQAHSAGGGHDAFHGQGGAKDVAEMEATVYLQKIAKSLHTILHEQHQPLVFAGVEELFGMYRKLDSSGRLLDGFVHGSSDRMDAEKLITKAEPIVREAAEKKQKETLEAYGNVAGTGKTSTELADILDAASAGKVDTLLLASGSEQWGTFDTETGRKELHEGPSEQNDELLGLAAQYTLQHKGRIVVLPPAEMPESKQIAAILRF